jgi:serum/glucocorticoid-regulated kinase 2
MAPEMLLRNGHGKELDIYCLGALLYELVIGIPPFYSKDMDEMFYDIVNEQVIFPR